MGYTHYFEKLEPDENLARITRKIVELGNVAICGGLGEGEPIITKAKIWLNGSAEKGEDFETFLIEKINDKDVSFNYLIKLYLLNEKELLNICINQNKHYFTNEPDITNFYTIVKNKSNEKVQALINKINLEEIKYSNWKVYHNIDDFISLIKVKPTRIKLNCESKPKFLISIPLYEKTKIIRDEGIIGTITPDLKSKLFNAYITSSSVEMCYFNKKELSDEYVYQHMKKIIELSAWDLLSSMYIFQDYNKAEFNKKYSGLFSYRKIQKGELILKQNVHSTGIFFIPARILSMASCLGCRKAVTYWRSTEGFMPMYLAKAVTSMG